MVWAWAVCSIDWGGSALAVCYALFGDDCSAVVELTMIGSAFVIFSDVDSSIDGSATDTCSALVWLAELLVNCGLERRFRTSDCKSCSSSESRFTTGICVNGIEHYVFTVEEGCVFIVVKAVCLQFVELVLGSELRFGCESQTLGSVGFELLDG